MLLAHFTPTEMPGTLAVWVAGIGLGLALGTRAGRAAVMPLALMAAFSGLGMLSETYDWASLVQVGIDVGFLLAASALAAALGLRLRGSNEAPGWKRWRIG